MDLLSLPKAARWYGALFTAQVLDLGTTAWALNRGAIEQNPVVLYFGWPLIIAFKLGLPVLLCLAASRALPAGGGIKVIQYAVIIYSAVVINNLRAVAAA